MAEIQGSVRKALSSMKKQSSVYEKLPDQEAYGDEESTSSTQRPWTKRDSPGFRTKILGISLILAIIFVVTLAMTGLMLVFKSLPNDSEPDVITCGHTPTEARNAGCRFEPMMSAWIPKKCTFQDLIDDNAGTFENWPFFSDQDIKQPITGAELVGVQVGNFTKVFTSHGTAHDLHCLYAWRKLNLAAEIGAKFIDSKSRSLHHTTHCARHIAQLVEEGAGYLPKEDIIRSVTALPLLYLDCVPLV
ncbi:hypothetical protein F5Y19DRAFT_489747 [Xylariaceae sp. FL1651]|nr:hypothetical protein F5Y19DRAFT_489747 [Xylariaceae sp. FL1651]